MTSIIKTIREQKGLSQEALAKVLHVSRPTMINIEQGKTEPSLSQIKKLCEVLEISPETLLQNKLPQDYEVNFLEKDSKKVEPANSMRIDVPQESVTKFKEVLLYILNKIGARPNIGQTVLYKLLYFIDFDYYEKFEEQLMGAVYIKNHFGPTPVAFKKIIGKMEADQELQAVKRKCYEYDQTTYLPLRKPNLDMLTAKEIKHIDEIIDKLGNQSAKELSNLSHKDVPWIVAKEGEPLRYESVFYRTNETSVREYTEE